jgi:hypothetical protein
MNCFKMFRKKDRNLRACYAYGSDHEPELFCRSPLRHFTQLEQEGKDQRAPIPKFYLLPWAINKLGSAVRLKHRDLQRWGGRFAYGQRLQKQNSHLVLGLSVEGG